LWMSKSELGEDESYQIFVRSSSQLSFLRGQAIIWNNHLKSWLNQMVTETDDLTLTIKTLNDQSVHPLISVSMSYKLHNNLYWSTTINHKTKIVRDSELPKHRDMERFGCWSLPFNFVSLLSVRWLRQFRQQFSNGN
jgi:hypothetical protein